MQVAKPSSENPNAVTVGPLPACSNDLPKLSGILAELGIERLSAGEGELLRTNYRMALTEENAILVFRHDDLKRLGADARLVNVPADVYVNMYFSGPTENPLRPEESAGIRLFQRNQVFTASPAVHKIVKPIVAKPFMPKAMPSYAEMANNAARETIDRYVGKGEIDFQEDYGQGFAFSFWRQFFDMTPEEAVELRSFMFGMAANGAHQARDRAGLIRYNQTAPKYIDLLVKIMRRARDSGKSAVLAWRAEQFAAVNQPPGDMPDSSEHSMATDMIDGFHALGIAIGNCAYALFGNQHAYSTLREDPSQIGHAVTEAFRLFAPVRLISRYTLEDIEFEGMHIPANTAIWLYWGAGNRDPLYFERPDEFDMTRSEPSITFGGGVQVCPGRNLAKTLATAALSPLLALDIEVNLEADKVEWIIGTPITGEMVPTKVSGSISKRGRIVPRDVV
jgi:cytochrome P450